MDKTQKPSFIPSAPSKPGEAAQGKFSADQWRTFSTIHLPITLIRLWGLKPGTRKYKMLVNFMHLVTAVRLANMRVMTAERIDQFEHHIQTYLEDLIGFGFADPMEGLYPHTRISPYQHMMLHFGSLLRRFGPVHSWRCFAFERLNYILQSFPTNSRFGMYVLTLLLLLLSSFALGELEQTMFERFCMSQRLKSIFHGEGLPPEVSTLATLYQETFEDADIRGTRITDALAFEDDIDEVVNIPSSSRNRLDAKTHSAVQQLVEAEVSPSVQFHHRIKRRDLIFSPQDDNFANAQVVITTANGGDWFTGSIQRIFTAIWSNGMGKQSSGIFAEVLSYKVLNGNIIDHYRQFGFAGGRLFYNELEENALIIPIDSITSHFAFTPQTELSTTVPVFHALPLNKVS